MGCLVLLLILSDVFLVIENLTSLIAGTASIDDFFSLLCAVVITIAVIIKHKNR